MNTKNQKTIDDVIGDVRAVDKKVDALAAQMQHGFLLVDEKFEALEARIDKKIDSKIDALAVMIQQGFSETAKHADMVALEARVTRLEKKAGLAAP